MESSFENDFDVEVFENWNRKEKRSEISVVLRDVCQLESNFQFEANLLFLRKRFIGKELK